MSLQTMVIMRLTAGHCNATRNAISASIWQVQQVFIRIFHEFRSFYNSNNIYIHSVFLIELFGGGEFPRHYSNVAIFFQYLYIITVLLG